MLYAQKNITVITLLPHTSNAINEDSAEEYTHNPKHFTLTMLQKYQPHCLLLLHF